MITQLIWTIWTSVSAVPRKAVKFNHSLTYLTYNTIFNKRKKFLNDVVINFLHDDIIKWKHFPRYWPFVQGIHWSPVNSPHKGQWCRALMFSLICTWINGWVNNGEAGDLRCHHAHYDITLMNYQILVLLPSQVSSPVSPYWLQGPSQYTGAILPVYGFLL